MAARSVNKLLEDIGKALNALPGVFSTQQWGGRAYKLPGPPGAGNRKKPKLLAHVWVSKDGDSVSVDFKLEKQRARDVVEAHDWIKPHSFRTLAPSGWISARLTNARQVTILKKLLVEARSLHRVEEPSREAETEMRGSVADPVARRIDAVMREARLNGWRPPALDDVNSAQRPQHRRLAKKK